jgi:hypothetical protein
MSSPEIICGKQCNLLIGSASYSVHQYSLSKAGREIDVTACGSSDYGDYFVCIKDGVISAQTYAYPTVEPNDVITVVATIASTPVVILTFANSKVISVVDSIDAKGLVGFTTTIRITQEPTVTTS